MRTPDPADVLVLAYNRPASLSRLLNRLNVSPVRSISVWIDGPKSGDVDRRDVRRCAEIACAHLAGPNDSVHVGNVNLGCRTSVTQGIEWFLQSHTSGIVLEDDILPSTEFFPYMQEALSLGPNFWPVELGSITGFNCVPLRHQQRPGSNRVSIFFSSWGWGTWASQWSRLRMELLPWSSYSDAIKENSVLAEHGHRYLRRVHGLISAGRLDSWAYVALLEHLRLGLSVQVPPISLVENHGFNGKASHTSQKPAWLLPDQATTSEGSGKFGAGLSDALGADECADRYMSREVFEFTAPWSSKKVGRRLVRWWSKRIVM